MILQRRRRAGAGVPLLAAPRPGRHHPAVRAVGLRRRAHQAHPRDGVRQPPRRQATQHGAGLPTARPYGQRLHRHPAVRRRRGAQLRRPGQAGRRARRHRHLRRHAHPLAAQEARRLVPARCAAATTVGRADGLPPRQPPSRRLAGAGLLPAALRRARRRLRPAATPAAGHPRGRAQDRAARRRHQPAAGRPGAPARWATRSPSTGAVASRSSTRTPCATSAPRR